MTGTVLYCARGLYCTLASGTCADGMHITSCDCTNEIHILMFSLLSVIPFPVKRSIKYEDVLFVCLAINEAANSFLEHNKVRYRNKLNMMYGIYSNKGSVTGKIVDDIT